MSRAVDDRAQLEALNQITYAINATLEVDQIFATIEREAHKLIDFDGITLALLDPRHVGSARVYTSPRRAGDGPHPAEVPVRGTLALIVKDRRPVIDSLLDAEPDIRSLVSAPLAVKKEQEEELIGTLTLTSRAPGRYSSEDLPLLEQIAAQLALAIDKARLFGEERRRSDQLRLLNDVAKEVVSSLERDPMIGRVVRLVHKAFDFVHLSAFLLDEPRARLTLVAVSGRWADKVPVGWSQPVDRGVIGRAVREARPYLADDTAHDPDYVPYPGIDSRTELAVPIVARGRVLGCLNAESHLVHAFDAEDVQTLSTIADQLATGIVNATLYAGIEDQVRAKTAELRAANQEIARQKELLARENVHLRATIERSGGDLIGASPKLTALLAVTDKAAASEATVLLQGESGTGKELFAARLHRASRRAAGPFVTINCGALPENLLESELFGHEQGAFTGAERRKPGLVETAEGGTLFLDEIGELPLPLQSKLLRFLQDGEFYRIGGKRPLRSDARVISATNKDLRREVAAGRYREDLLFRLNTITLDIPPLRERADDIPRLARYFLDRFRKGRRLEIGDTLMRALVNYAWPGNVRELANLLERLAILGEDGELGLELVPSYIAEAAARNGGEAATRAGGDQPAHTPAPAAPEPAVRPLKDLEREHIQWALTRNRGDKTRTARELGIALKTLYNKLERYRL